jgi:hypothetical protein
VQQQDERLRRTMMTQGLDEADKAAFESLLRDIPKYLAPAFASKQHTVELARNQFAQCRGVFCLPQAYRQMLPDHPLWNVPNKHALGQVCAAFSHIGLLVAFFLHMMKQQTVRGPDPCLYKRAILVLRNMRGGILRMVYAYKWDFISSGGVYDVQAKKFAPLPNHDVFESASEPLKLAYAGHMSETDVADLTFGVGNCSVLRELKTHSHFVGLAERLKAFYSRSRQSRPVIVTVRTPFDDEFAIPVQPDPSTGRYPREHPWYGVKEPFARFHVSPSS